MAKEPDFSAHLQRFNSFLGKIFGNPASPLVDEWLGKGRESFNWMIADLERRIAALEAESPGQTS